MLAEDPRLFAGPAASSLVRTATLPGRGRLAWAAGPLLMHEPPATKMVDSMAAALGRAGFAVKRPAGTGQADRVPAAGIRADGQILITQRLRHR